MSRARLDNPGGASVSPEDVQDIVGAEFIDSTTIDFIYNDGAGTVTANVLDSPKLNGQLPAFYLDRANHTGTQLAATISDFSTSVTALLTDANLPDNLTLTNITQITNRDHGNLQDLGADDHTQYALLAGRAGGQSLIGGPNAGDDLTLNPGNSTGSLIFDFAGGFAENVEIPLHTSLGGVWGGVNIAAGQTITPSVNAFGVRGMVIAGTWIHTLPHTGTPYLVFNLGPIVQLQGAGGGGASTVNMGNMTGYQFAPVVQLTSANAFGAIATNANSRAFTDLTTFQANALGATATVAGWTGFDSFPTVDTGFTVTDYRRFRIRTAAGAGTITTDVGVDIADMQAFGGTLTNRAMGVRSRVPILVTDTDGDTMTNASVAVEIDSTTRALLLPRMTTAQKNALTAVVGMVVYDTTTGNVEAYTTTGGPGWVAL